MGVAKSVFLSNKLYFLGRESVQMHLRKFILDCSYQLYVIGQGGTVYFCLWVESPLHANFRGTPPHRIRCLFLNLPPVQPIGTLFTSITTKGTETTVLFADIGEVDVAINYIGHKVASLSVAQLVSRLLNCRDSSRFGLL